MLTKKQKTLRSIDVPLIKLGGATFRVNLYPVVSNDDGEWWHCMFSVHTRSDPNRERTQTQLLTARSDVWRMRDLNRARHIIAELFSTVDEITLQLRTQVNDNV